MRELEATSWWNEAMRDIAGMLLHRSSIPSRGIFLDAGCGSGQTMAWFLERHPRWTGVGLDIAADGLSLARDNGIAVCRATTLCLPLRDNALDLIISLDVLQHLPPDDGDVTALGEFSRVLRSGGTLLLRTNAQSFPRAREDRDVSFRKYEPRLLRRRLIAAGFEPRFLGRCNALLGLAEIPRELAAAREQPSDYHGILAEERRDSRIAHRLRRGWLTLEGRALAAGLSLPLGRTLFALCRARK